MTFTLGLSKTCKIPSNVGWFGKQAGMKTPLISPSDLYSFLCEYESFGGIHHDAGLSKENQHVEPSILITLIQIWCLHFLVYCRTTAPAQTHCCRVIFGAWMRLASQSSPRASNIFSKAWGSIPRGICSREISGRFLRHRSMATGHVLHSKLACFSSEMV